MTNDQCRATSSLFTSACLFIGLGIFTEAALWGQRAKRRTVTIDERLTLCIKFLDSVWPD